MVKDYGLCSCGGRIHPQWFFGKKFLECAKCGNTPTRRASESKKLPPIEKAIDSGIASGATMEGLDLALGAEDWYGLKKANIWVLDASPHGKEWN